MNLSIVLNDLMLLFLPLPFWFDLSLRVGIHDILIHHFVGVEDVMIHRPHRDILPSLDISGRLLRIADHLLNLRMIIVKLSLGPGLINGPTMIN